LWKAYSAGTHPTGFVHSKALQVLSEIGIEHQGRSKSVEELRDLSFDIIVTVCDSASEECPVWLGQGTRYHRSFPDPARATGSEDEVTDVFRKVRDEIASEISKLIEEI
jgi:arsenate reductase